ncbi:chymotrypsinogen B-like [Lampetra fluviatilis]
MKIETVAVLQSPGRISSGGVTPFYNDTLFFVWEVNAGPGLNVKLNFSSLRLEDDPLCLNESLTVYDGWRSPNTSLGSFCGSKLPPSVRSTSSSLQLLLRLRNNQPWKGFDLSFLETSQVPSMKGCGVQYSAGGRDRIVGGTPATSGKWPWQASLRNYGSHVCGASLISERWLVAAAHCFMYSSNVYEWQVYLGITYIYDSANAVIVNVAQIITHERFNISTIDYDIALVRLSDPVSFNHRVSPICLPPSTSHFPQPGKTCFISGWGRTSLAESGIHYDLLEAPMQIFSHEACSSNLMNGDLITTRMICIGHPAGAISSCQGDSGGPLACQGTDKAWYLSGVTSWAFDCALPMKPSVYTKTSKFLPWIKRYTDLP